MSQRSFKYANPRLRRADRVKGIRSFLRTQLESYRRAKSEGVPSSQLRVRAELFARTLDLLKYG